MDKRLIAERFARARNTYGREARVQQQVAEKMLGLVEKQRISLGTKPPFRRIVEFGCGTGGYSRLLLERLHPESLLLNDLCDEMQECLEELLHGKEGTEVSFLGGDAEELAFPLQSDLITSCSTLQWFAHPDRFFTRCHRFLATEGMLAFSTFGRENMREIRRLTGNGLPYPPLEELTAMLSPRFRLLHAEEETVTLWFDTPIQVLRHLKQTGVTGTEKIVWTRGKLQTFCDRYQQLFGNEEGKVPLTYHPIYIIAEKQQ